MCFGSLPSAAIGGAISAAIGIHSMMQLALLVVPNKKVCFVSGTGYAATGVASSAFALALLFLPLLLLHQALQPSVVVHPIRTPIPKPFPFIPLIFS